MESLKGQVIRLFLQFIARFVPLEKAQIATLGGRGFEANIWKESNIPPENGWLIEHSRELGGKLINTHRYRTQNQLGTFSRIMAGFGEDRAFVDAFHLDLCGTLSDKAIFDFASVLPLVLKSKGRCLAITVADQRRNLVLEQWPEFQVRGKKLFGKQAEVFFNQLANIQQSIPIKKDTPTFIKPFDSIKATKREFGLLVELAELLHIQSLPWSPMTIERYVYVSRFQGRPFRMRTYFFRFGSKKLRGEIPTFAQTWAKSQLFFANGSEFKEIKTPTVGATKEEKEITTMTTSKLAALVSLLGGVFETEYNTLLTKSQKLDTIFQALKGVSEGNVENPQPVQEVPAVETEPASRPRKAKKNWDDLDDREQVAWKIKALELRAASKNGHWENGAWKDLLKEDFGHFDQKLSKSLRAALAHTSGGFRDMFVARIEKVFGGEAKPYLDRLAKI